MEVQFTFFWLDMKVHPSSLKLPTSSSNLFMNQIHESFVSASPWQMQLGKHHYYHPCQLLSRSILDTHPSNDIQQHQRKAYKQLKSLSYKHPNIHIISQILVTSVVEVYWQRLVQQTQGCFSTILHSNPPIGHIVL